MTAHNRRRLIALMGLALAMASLLGPVHSKAEASAPTLVAQSTTAVVGETVSVPIVLSDVPSGLAGFDLAVTLSNSRVASITSVTFPDFGLTRRELVSGSEAHVRAVDLQRLIESGATNSTLATLSIKALRSGTSDISIQIARMDDDAGFPIQAQTLTGTISVKKGLGGGRGKGGN